MTTEEWKPIPNWPGYEVSSLGKVRKVRILVGKYLRLTFKGKTREVIASTLYREAFGQEPLTEASRVSRRRNGETWRLVRQHLFDNGLGSIQGVSEAIVRDDKERFGVVTFKNEALRHRTFRLMRRYLDAGLVERSGYGTYRLTERGVKAKYPGRAR